MFNKANIAAALIVAANAGAFTPNQAAGFRQLRQKAEPFTAADIPRISGLFAQFDADSNSEISPKEIWAVYKSNTDEAKPENKVAFMKAMDSNLRTFCGVDQRVEEAKAVPVSRRGKRGGKKGGKNGKWMKKMMKGKKMMKKMMFGLGGRMKVAKLFMPFSKADANNDMKVTPMEMGAFMNKMSKKVCKKYMKMQMKINAKKWIEAGMPAEELAKMKAKRAEMKKKMEARKKQMKNKWSQMKKKWNNKNKRGGKRGGRKGDKGRD